VAIRIERLGGFELPCPALKALPFFTPEGERRWVDGWDPRAVFPEGEAVVFTQGAVFRIERGGEREVWTIVRADSAAGLADYVQVVEGSRLTRIRVEVASLGPARCRVSVRYTLTALSEAGGAFLDGLSEQAYAARMSDWERRVTACLR
jgi:hypothetical protein